MKTTLKIYNTYSRTKENFEPISNTHVGIYVCGPTVYGDPHLGHARPAITFDIVFRYLKHLGYKVRYIRNITDVGHLEHDSDDGEDKILKKARTEQLEPMEVAQHYTNRYVDYMKMLNVLPPSIEPRASGHIIEQIELIQQIIKQGFAYEINGSVYFDVKKYNDSHNYGALSGRKIDDLLVNTRTLDKQDEKRFSADFALWKKATPEHIMKWNSPWSLGFPGWHLECSAMGTKYLGEVFDIHGGGMDLIFPHHECEIAQNIAAIGKNPAKYWMHNNMITINGQKMGKSLGNFITLEEFFEGKHSLLEKSYNPMTIRFFILQAHYRSTLDFSNHALQSAEKAHAKLNDAKERIEKLNISEQNKEENKILALIDSAYSAINEDFNTPLVIACLFEASKIINNAAENKISINKNEIDSLNFLFNTFYDEILGLNEKYLHKEDNDLTNQLLNTIMTLRNNAKLEKNWALSDLIRTELAKIGVTIKDTKDGAIWEKN